MKILVAVDGSSFTKRMLGYLGAHEQWLGPAHEYTVLHTVTPLPARAASALDKTTIKTYYESECEKVFKPLRPFFKRHGIEADFIGKVGPAADTIAATADKGRFDLLVLGSHGHGSVAGLVLGSVSTKVVARCGTPVLLVR